LEEPDYLHRYNQRLISKLEDKLAELDTSNRRLVEEIRRKEEAESKIRYLAYFDVLTGLPNRVGLLEHAEQALAAGRHDGLGGAVVIIDIDHFREINHTLGHHNGNLLLRQVAIRMQDALTEGHPYLARLGGDKFAVLLHKIEGPQAIERTLKALVECFERPFELEQLGVQVTANFGVSLFPEHGEDPAVLLRNAEVAMDPGEGARGAVSFYSPDADPFEPKRLSLISDLRRGIDHGQLVLHYQPKIDLAAGCTVGVEALVRWQHPQFGLLGPDRFVRLAEQTGQIRAMTSWLLEEGIRELASWREFQIELDLCLNLTVRDLLDEDLPFEVGALLEQKGLQQARLTFEMTESAILRDPGRARRSLERLAGMGVKLAIDDFGTGYSSLSHLRFLPVKELKIDKSFVINMMGDGNDAAIVRSTIDFGHNLGLTVTAEGIEDEQILEMLCGLGCDQAQGFLIGRPMPSDALLTWLDQTSWKLRP
jgi:diguanylate cyclase (GGDEF)-like protein